MYTLYNVQGKLPVLIYLVGQHLRESQKIRKFNCSKAAACPLASRAWESTTLCFGDLPIK